jgi:hypothetical protein
MVSRTLIAAGLLMVSSAAIGEPGPPGKSRVALAAAGTGGVAAGTVWFFALGDSLGAGDPASVLMATGAVGVLGAAVGAVATTGNETGFDDRAAVPPIAVSLGTGGTPYFGEEIPYPATVTLQPRFWIANRARITLGGAAHVDLGNRIDRDWRPQVTSTPALTSRSTGLDLDSELRLYLANDIPIDLAIRPVIHHRRDRYTYQSGGNRTVLRTQVVPAALGVRWHLSGRQRFETFLGPRWDALAWSTPTGTKAAALQPGPVFLDTRYTLDAPHHRPVFGLNATSRASLGYVHSNFDGSGLNVAAVVGFMGPFYAEYDLRLRRRLDRWGLQLGVDATVGEGGGLALSIGGLPPTRGAQR